MSFSKLQFQKRQVDKAWHDMPERDRYVDGLSTADVENYKRMFFGPDRGPEESERTNRLFKSTLELGFPQPGESESQVI